MVPYLLFYGERVQNLCWKYRGMVSFRGLLLQNLELQQTIAIGMPQHEQEEDSWSGGY